MSKFYSAMRKNKILGLLSRFMTQALGEFPPVTSGKSVRETLMVVQFIGAEDWAKIKIL